MCFCRRPVRFDVQSINHIVHTHYTTRIYLSIDLPGPHEIDADVHII